MVAGVDKFLLRETANAKAARASQWPGDAAAHREHLKTIIGAIDPRVPFWRWNSSETTKQPALVAETDKARILRVRWPVLDGVHGEGILIQPKGKPVARVIYIPDADTEPEKLADDAMLAYSGCEIVIPALISRGVRFLRQRAASACRRTARTASGSTGSRSSSAATSSATRCRRFSR